MFNDILYCIPPEKHDKESLKAILGEHPEVAFISLVGVDINGNNTDERIPVKLFMDDIDGVLSGGVQTDGSSVQLPLIADISDAKVTLVPDTSVNWYVDHNEDFIEDFGGELKPVGTLRIPATLVHNETREVGSRVILKNAVEAFKKGIKELVKEHPYLLEYLPLESADDIDEVLHPLRRWSSTLRLRTRWLTATGCTLRRSLKSSTGRGQWAPCVPLWSRPCFFWTSTVSASRWATRRSEA